MSKKLETAKNLYLKGIKEGHIDVVDKYTGARYTQHSTGVPDGAAGFKEFFADFLNRTNDRDIRVIRAIEDGRHVFVHVYQDIDNGKAKWVTTDMFDTDENDKMIEHWDVIAAYTEVEDTVSGNDVVLGDFELNDLDKTEENKEIVKNLINNVFQNGKYDMIDQYIHKDYIQHAAHLPNGIEPIKQLLAEKDIYYDFIFKIIGQGNYVVSYCKIVIEGNEFAGFDIFRIEDGMIVEHWDNKEPIPPRSELTNSGKF
ncbi:nuclear transport factor 2 family protein [Psychroserpens sp. MEBiC05023]